MDPYIGEIRIFAGMFAPDGWQYCQGQMLSINGNEALFQLIGTTYGGDGQTTFALPNLSSRVVVGQGQLAGGASYQMGQMPGVESVTLNANQLAAHTHPFTGSVAASAGGAGTTNPGGNYFGDQGRATNYASTLGNTPGTLGDGAIVGQSSPAGSSQAHANIQPVLAISYIISMQGIYPSPQ